ncbi:WD repeat-containing protein 74 isoform X2 [Narcine bancroftii]|uniref:WD repeat-containing protein 74 isoform X2 n=1 Tax=Narcine bancroftii TaxID=1343680 RepID=UPI003831ABAB
MAARWNHVWVGTETGILKGVNLQQKRATNYTNISTLSRDQEICAMCWGYPPESEVLLGCLNGTVKVFSTEKEKFTEFRDCSRGEGPFRGLATYDSSLITCVESGLLKVWKEQTDHAELQVGPGVCRMRQQSDRMERVATGGKENELKVWDVQVSQGPVFTAKNVRNDWLDLRVPVWVRDVQFIPASDKIVTCTGYSQVRVYDPNTQRRPVLQMTYGEYPLTALSLMSDANSVVVGNTHGELAVLDLRKGKLLKCLKGQAGSVRDVQCHPSLPLVASCGLDRFLRVHHVAEKRLLYKVYLKSQLSCLLFTSRDNWEAEEKPLGEVTVKEEEEDDDKYIGPKFLLAAGERELREKDNDSKLTECCKRDNTSKILGNKLFSNVLLPENLENMIGNFKLNTKIISDLLNHIGHWRNNKLTC